MIWTLQQTEKKKTKKGEKCSVTSDVGSGRGLESGAAGVAVHSPFHYKGVSHWAAGANHQRGEEHTERN